MNFGWIFVLLGIILAGSGTFCIYYGQDILRNANDNQKTVINSKPIISPQEEKLLSIIYKYQKDFGLKKLIIGRDGFIIFQNKQESKDKINIIGELYGVDSDYSKYSGEFENIMIHIPPEYLRPIPEARLDSPYVVVVTEEGISYLKQK